MDTEIYEINIIPWDGLFNSFNVILFPAAKGSPTPSIMWRRETSEPIPTADRDGKWFYIGRERKIDKKFFLSSWNQCLKHFVA